MTNDLLEIKPVWTDEDYPRMSWHDCPVHAMAFIEEGTDDNPCPGLLFDIDYFFQWVLNDEGDYGYYSFYISPCTLYFRNVFDRTIADIFPTHIGPPEISHIKLTVLRDEPEHHYKSYNCEIHFHDSGKIAFTTTGYEQYVRKEPILLNSQGIPYSLRDGVGFDRKTIEKSLFLEGKR